MNHASAQEASSTQLNEWIDDCIVKGPQIITRKSEPVAVLVSFEQWQILMRTRKQSLKELLLTENNKVEMFIPKRGRLLSRRKD